MRNNESDGRVKAAEFRDKHRLGSQPLPDLVALIEQTTGVDVAVVDTDADEHGMTMRNPVSGATFIAVACTPHPLRQRSTLAHELAHVLFEDWSGTPSLTSTDPEEIRANAFARHLLIPVDGVAETLGDAPGDLAALSKLVQLFGASPAIVAIAMRDADYISETTRAQWATETSGPRLAAKFGWSDQYQAMQAGALTTRAPQKLLARAVQGYVDNVVSAQTVATLRGIPAAEAVDQLTAEGIIPAPMTPNWGTVTLPAVDVDVSDFPEAQR